MPTREQIISFHQDPPPAGVSPYVDGATPSTDLRVVDPDPTWPAAFDDLAAVIRGALGLRAIAVDHTGSTSVPGLAAKPVIDIDLTVADPDDEGRWLPPLLDAGFRLTVREPWWWGHRVLRPVAEHLPACHLHVFGPDSPEVVKHRVFRQWLSADADDRALYARTKREASATSTAAGEHGMQYNARKEQVVREIYQRAFAAAGLLDQEPAT